MTGHLYLHSEKTLKTESKAPGAKRRILKFTTALASSALLFGAVGCAPTNTETQPADGAKPVVALLLPENVNPKWQKDADIFTAELKKSKPDAEVIVYTANNDDAVQQSQFETALTKGAKVVVLCAVDSASAAKLAERGAKENVPVVAFDHQINNSPNVALYVSPDGTEQGKITGEYVAEKTQKGDRIMFLNGSPTDNNAKLYHEGYHGVLDPLIKSGERELAGEAWTTGWDPQTAQRNVEQLLTTAQNKVDALVIPWDDGAGVAAQALKAQGLTDQVVLTGGDATAAALQRILLGTQTMTVLRDDREEARISAQATAGLLTDGKVPSSLVTGTVNNGAADIPAALLTPKIYDINNVAELVTDGWVTKEELCQGIPAGTGPC